MGQKIDLKRHWVHIHKAAKDLCKRIASERAKVSQIEAEDLRDELKQALNGAADLRNDALVIRKQTK